MHNKKRDEKLENAEVVYLQPSNLENIDFSVFEWVDEHLNISIETNKGFEKVPVIWTSAERSFQSKNDKELRDSEGGLIYPIMTIARTSVTKPRDKRGVFFAPMPEINDYRGGAVKITKKLNQNKTANFANADAFKNPGIRQINFVLPKKREKKEVFKTISIPLPVYIEANYQISIKAQFQQQMNQMINPFISNVGGINYFPLSRNGHFYEAFIQDDFGIANNVENMGSEERTYEAKVNINVFAYLVGEGDNQAKPFLVERENPVQVRFMREKSSLGEKNDRTDPVKDYRNFGE